MKDEIATLKKTINELKNKPAEHEKMTAEINALKNLIARVKEVIDKQIPEYDKKDKALRKSQEIATKSVKAYEEAQKKRSEAETILDGCRAGILAELLKDGEACPVCGSKTHPAPARLPHCRFTVA